MLSLVSHTEAVLFMLLPESLVRSIFAGPQSLVPATLSSFAGHSTAVARPCCPFLRLTWPSLSTLMLGFPRVSAVVSGLTFQPLIWRGWVTWAEFYSIAGEYPILKNHLLGLIVLLFCLQHVVVLNSRISRTQMCDYLKFSITVLDCVGLDNKTTLSSLLWPCPGPGCLELCSLLKIPLAVWVSLVLPQTPSSICPGVLMGLH